MTLPLWAFICLCLLVAPSDVLIVLAVLYALLWLIFKDWRM